MSSFQLIFPISTIWIISEIILAIVKRSGENENKALDKASLRILWITIVISIALGVYLSTRGVGFIHPGYKIISSCGLISIVLGLMLRWTAILTLRKYFTVDVSISSEQKLIETGLYRYIRHPAYTGSLLSFLGLGLSLSNWLSTLIIALSTFFAFSYRIRIEEAALIGAFGEKYLQYSARTKRLIPGIY